MKKKMKVGVVGAGAISDIYLQNMINVFDNLDVVAVCANHLEHAQAKADKYGINACTYDEMMNNDEIEMIVNLTPANAHYRIIKDALEHDKHVYTEKVMTDDPVTAAELVKLADEKGLYLGSAPDTFMGAAIQSAKDVIDSGTLGTIHSFVISANRDNRILDSMFAFHRLPGSGAGYDYGVYYVTALVSLLGPIGQVAAKVDCPYPKKTGIIPGTPDFGKEFDTPNESQVAAILRLKNNITGTFHMDCDSVMVDKAFFTIYGTDGILYLTDPNQFGGELKLCTSGDPRNPQPLKVLKSFHGYSENSRGLGPSEMVDAIYDGKKNRASKEMAQHVLDVLSAIIESSEKNAFIDIKSDFEKPEAMPRKKAPVVNIGHTSFNMKNADEMLHFYGEVLGMKKQFTLTTKDYLKMRQSTGEGEKQDSEITPEKREQYEKIMSEDKPWLICFKLADGQFIELFYDLSNGNMDVISPEERGNIYGYNKLNYEVDDITAIRDHIIECGGKIDHDIHPTLDGSLEIIVHDPDGNEVQFTQYGAAGKALIEMENPLHEVCSKVKYTTQIAFQVHDDLNMFNFYTRGLGLKHAGRLTLTDFAAGMEASGKADPQIITRLKMRGNKPFLDYIEVAPHQYIELFYSLKPYKEKRNLKQSYGYQHICIEVSDIHEAWDVVTANGVVPDTEIKIGADGAHQFLLVDPDGNRIELKEYTENAMQRL